jgi:hypothetical protein
MQNQRQPLTGTYSKSFFESSMKALISTLRFIAALLRKYAATSSNFKKPQTMNGKYLHAATN